MSVLDGVKVVVGVESGVRDDDDDDGGPGVVCGCCCSCCPSFLGVQVIRPEFGVELGCQDDDDGVEGAGSILAPLSFFVPPPVVDPSLAQHLGEACINSRALVSEGRKLKQLGELLRSLPAGRMRLPSLPFLPDWIFVVIIL